MLEEFVFFLRCPQSGSELQVCRVEEAEARIGAALVPRAASRNARGEVSAPFGRTPMLLLRTDYLGAYPIVDGVPILLAPEMLTPSVAPENVDLGSPQYAESYDEMRFYNDVAREESLKITQSDSFAAIEPILRAERLDAALFPGPRAVWIDAIHDCAAQWDAYSYLSPMSGKRALQLGGKGTHAVKFLLAGATEAWLLTPMLGEALCALALAKAAGVADRLHCVVGVAEEMPLANESIDCFYSGGCVHHMQTDLAFPEIARVLRPAGRFAAADPWRAPLYGIGTRLLGKRETSVYCKPLTKRRLQSLEKAFSSHQIVQHGTLTRYPLLALQKFGVNSGLTLSWCCNAVDDALCSVIPGMRGMGSSVAVLGQK